MTQRPNKGIPEVTLLTVNLYMSRMSVLIDIYDIYEKGFSVLTLGSGICVNAWKSIYVLRRRNKRVATSRLHNLNKHISTWRKYQLPCLWKLVKHCWCSCYSHTVKAHRDLLFRYLALGHWPIPLGSPQLLKQPFLPGTVKWSTDSKTVFLPISDLWTSNFQKCLTLPQKVFSIHKSCTWYI